MNRGSMMDRVVLTKLFQVRPPSSEYDGPRSWKTSNASYISPRCVTYWLGIFDHTGSLAVVAPIESVMTCHVSPSSRVTMPLYATYCHSGPSCPNSQFLHVLPPSSDTPQPLPTVPYQTCPRSPKPNACTKSHEIACAAVSLEDRICCHVLAPGRSTKMPWP